MSDDDIAQLKRMRDRGEITSAQYETLRRHVLWGTPLPEAVESLAAEEDDPPATSWQPYVPGTRRAAPPSPPPGSPPPGSPPPGSPSPPRPAWPPLDDEPTQQHRQPEQPGRHRSADDDPRREPQTPPPPPYRPTPRQPQPPWSTTPAAGPPPNPWGTAPATPPPARAQGTPAGTAYTGPPSGAFPPATPGGTAYTGHPSGTVPAVGPGGTAYTGPATGAQPAVGGARRPVPELPSTPAARKRRKRGRGPITFIVSLLLAVALAGAGVWWFVLRQTGVSPADYARGVCAKVQGWHDDVTAKNGALQQALNTNTDPEATRSALSTFFDQVTDRTHQLRSDVAAVGVPAISAGQSYVDGLTQKIDDTATAFGTSATKARALDINNPATFEINVQILQSQVDQQISGVSDALAGTNTPGELRTAYNNDSTCAPFTG